MSKINLFCRGDICRYRYSVIRRKMPNYCLLMKHLNGWNRRHYFFRWSPGFGFFIYPYYSKRTHYPTLEKLGSFFFSITDTDYSQDSSRGREGTIVYSNLPLPPANEYSDIYLQLCMWGDYHVFQIATFVFAWLLLDLIYQPPYRITIWLIDWSCNICLFTWRIDSRFLLQRFGIGNQWISTRINYDPCITSEPTNQVC